MFGVIYILVCLLTGFAITENVIGTYDRAVLRNVKKNKTSVSSFFIKFPLYYVTGTLSVTWTVYISACIFSKCDEPLIPANLIALILYSAIDFVLIFRKRKTVFKTFSGALTRITGIEIAVFVIVLMFWILLDSLTLSYSDGMLDVGVSVFSDFTPHLSMVRSFSKMQNFPSDYTFFAGEDMKYHFMFQFLCGNLEFLGFRLDLALNVPSIISMVTAYMALYSFAVRLFSRRSVGFLSMLLLTFRSSFSFFIFAGGLQSGRVLEELSSNRGFIGSTQNESWGLWNLNVYCNQRHLAFCLTIAIIVLYYMMPAVEEAFARLCRGDGLINTFRRFIFESLLSREGWKFGDIRLSIFMGIMLGLSGFWNGAVFVAVILVLFFMAVVSDRRTDFLIIGVTGALLSLIQAKCFIDSSVFTTTFYYGFLSEGKTMVSSIVYLVRLLGILPILMAVIFAVSKPAGKYMIFCASVPLIFAFTVSLTPDVAVNHKYVMFSVMLFDVFAARFLVSMFRVNGISMKVLTCILVFTMTVTGVYDMYCLLHTNVPEANMHFNPDSELQQWIWQNTDHHAIFLTPDIFLRGNSTGEFILSGARIYDGWPYYAWSAGYDTFGRGDVQLNIYEAENIDSLYEIVDKEKIRYIFLNVETFTSETFDLHFDTLYSAFEPVYFSNDDEWVYIFDTSKRKKQPLTP